MKKKLIAGMTSAAVIASLSAPAFAANFGDVKGTNAESAAALLKALGVVNGDVNGNYNPSATITRAEFAKIAVKIAGLGAAADAYGTGAATGFNDVPAGHWAAGYVSVAKAAGLVKGYDAWNFGPTDNVRYEDVLTVVERILGYNDNLTGGYSAGYVVKGAALGLTKNTQFKVGTPATRGDVAVIANAALTTDTVVYDTVTNYFNDSTHTLLDAKYSNASVTAELSETGNAVGTSLKSGQARIGSYAYNTNADTIIVGGSLDALVGHDVTVVADKDNNASYIGDATLASNVVTGSVSVANASTAVTVSSGVYSIAVGSTKYTVDPSAVYFYNGANQTQSFLNSKTTDGDAVTVVLNKKTGYAQFVGVKHYEAPTIATADGVAATDLSDALVTAGSTVYVAPSTVITRNGQPAKVTDIKKGDVLYWTKSTSTDAKGNIYATALDVYNNPKTGTLQSYALKSDGVSVKNVVVDGTTYAVNGSFSIKTTDAGFPAFNTSVTLTLDKDGNVAKLATAASTAVSTTYFVEKVNSSVALLVNNQVVTYTQFTLLGSDGKVVTKYVAKQSDGTTNVTAVSGVVAGNVYSLTFDANGYVNGATAQTFNGAAASLATGAVSTTNNTIKVGANTYNVLPTTLFVDESAALSGSDYTKATGVTFANIKDGQSVKVVVDPNNVGNLLAVVADTSTGVSAQLSQQSGIFVSRYTTNDGTTTKNYVTVFANGQNQTFQTNSAISGAVGDAVYLKDIDNGGLGDGIYDTLGTGAGSQTAIPTVANDVYISNGFTFNSGKYVYNNNTKVYIAKKDSTGAYTVYSNGAISDFTQYLANPGSVPPVELTTTSTVLGGYSVVDAIVIYK